MMVLRSSSQQSLTIDGVDYKMIGLKSLGQSLEDAALREKLSKLPRTMKILLENMVRHGAETDSLCSLLQRDQRTAVTLHPARILMQDFTALPALVDLAALRDSVKNGGGDPQRVNPVIPLDVVVDHSIIVDEFASSDAEEHNMKREFERNGERYRFLRWGQQAFDKMRLIPPGSGICHQVNLEYLAKVVIMDEEKGEKWIYPDTVLGTDSHTTMVNGLGVLGWGVGGIEAESSMLGFALSMALPKVVGCHLRGRLETGVTATDLVLSVTQQLRHYGVVGAFVEFHGEGVSHLSLSDRATIANMAPEYGATCGFFPIDGETMNYLKLTGREEHHCRVVESYAQEQGLWHEVGLSLSFDEIVEIDCSAVEPCLAGPTRPQDRVPLAQVPQSFDALNKTMKRQGKLPSSLPFGDGAVVIAAITSCTNTSNPRLMLMAGLLARAARMQGLKTKEWVKTSLAPGSRVVSGYLENAGLMEDLEYLGFHIVGYGCTTCIGNSGPLPKFVEQAVKNHDLCVASVLSGNRNFEGRVHPQVKANYLASPPLVVAYALLGRIDDSLLVTPLGKNKKGIDVFLSDLWPEAHEVDELMRAHVTPELFADQYASLEEGPSSWRSLDAPSGETYDWHEESTYVRSPPFFDDAASGDRGLIDGRALAILGDSVTTDHISPASSIPFDGEAAAYLRDHHVTEDAFNSFGARRGNHEVMLRGTLANIRLRNQLAEGREGGWTRIEPEGKIIPIYEAARLYEERDVPLVIMAGLHYGSGSSRDWAAKGVRLLGVRAVIAESFERIHRSNLIGMGVLPLTLPSDMKVADLKLTGSETYSLRMKGDWKTFSKASLLIKNDNQSREIKVTAVFHTEEEIATYRCGGLLPMVREKILAELEHHY